MSTYADYFTSDLFFVTCDTVDHEPVLVTSVAVHLLRTVLNQVKQTHAFRMLGYVFLPDHLHLLIKPKTGVVLDQIVGGLRKQFSQEYGQLMGIPGQMIIWEAKYPVHKVQDADDFAIRLDYLHYNPVQHKLVQKPEDWPNSSYRAWCTRGLYQAGWGWTEPERVQGKHWG
jgi:putative transposase